MRHGTWNVERQTDSYLLSDLVKFYLKTKPVANFLKPLAVLLLILRPVQPHFRPVVVVLLVAPLAAQL